MQDTVLCRHKHKQGGGKSPPRFQYNTLASFGSEVRNSYGITIEFALQTRVQNWRRMQVQHPENKRFGHSPPLRGHPATPRFSTVSWREFCRRIKYLLLFLISLRNNFFKEYKS